VFNSLKTDARVLRQINALKNDYKIMVVSYGGMDIDGVDQITLKSVKIGFFHKIIGAILLALRIYKPVYWIIYNYKSLKNTFEGDRFDAIIANDIETLPLANFLDCSNKIIYDAHEYSTRQFDNDLKWRLLFKGFTEYLAKKFIPQTTEMIAQNKLFAKEFNREFGVNPVVITNAPEYADIRIKEVDLQKIQIIHHGIYNATRKLERLIDVIELLDKRYSLTLMLHLPILSNESSRNQYERFIHRIRDHERITLLSAVKGQEVVRAICNFDIGIHLLEPINFNHKFSLPNKILEFIQARLAVVIGPSPGMVDIVNNYDVGVISNDFAPEAVAQAIKNMTIEKIMHFKRMSDKAARELSYERNAVVLRELLMKVIA